MSTTAEARKMSGGIGIDVNPAVYQYLLDLVEKGEISNQEMTILLLAFNDLEVRKVQRSELVKAILKTGSWRMCAPIILKTRGPLLVAYFQLLVWLNLYRIDKDGQQRLKKIFSLIAEAIGE